MDQAVQIVETRPSRIVAKQTAWTAALARHRRGEADAAIGLYERHLKRFPQDAAGWLNLGAALRRTRRFGAALVCYQRALRLRPDDAGLWSNLGNLWKDMDCFGQALQAHERAVRLAPGRLQVRVNYAIALREAGEFARAASELDACLEHEPERPDLAWERALVSLYLGDYGAAWPDYEARWQTGQQSLPPLRSTRWRGEPIAGKQVLLFAEQGFGDTLWAARYASTLVRRGATVTLACHPALHPVFANIDALLQEPSAELLGSRCFDFHCPLMSLPGVIDKCSLPVVEPVDISVPDASHRKMERYVAPYRASFRIGIVWSGSTSFADNARRAVSLKRFLPLASLPGVQLFSLQKGPPVNELRELGGSGFIVNLAPRLRDFGDTAAAIEQMDLIVMTDSSVAHLAGSMGVPILNLLQFKPYWIYGMSGDSTPWYPTMRLIRQQSPGDWDGVFREVIRLVGKWAEVRARQNVR